MMVGRAVHEVKTSARELGNVVLEVRNLTRYGVVEEVSFKVHRGEIVTLAGLVGAGRSEVANCIFGIDSYDTGEVLINGERVAPNDPTAAIQAGIGFIPEDRRRQALVAQLSVSANTTLSVLQRIAPRWIILNERENEIMYRSATVAFDKDVVAEGQGFYSFRRQSAEGRDRSLASPPAKSSDP